MCRVITELRPRWVLGENVAGFINMGLDKTIFDLAKRDTLFSPFVFPACGVGAWHERQRTFIVAADVSRPLPPTKGDKQDAANLDVFLSDNGIFRKRNKNRTIWSLSPSAAVFYLTPAASEGYRSTLKPTAFRNQSPSSNLSAQMIRQEQPVSDTAALNPDWVEWLMGFPRDGRTYPLEPGARWHPPCMTERMDGRALRLKTLGNAVCPPRRTRSFNILLRLRPGTVTRFALMERQVIHDEGK